MMKILLISISLITLLATCEKSPAPPAPTGMAPAMAVNNQGTGDRVFHQVCFACHGTGAAGAPKVGDKNAWVPRIAQGKDILYRHAHEGFHGEHGVMPPRGGRPDLTDTEVNAAVDYMVSRVPAG